MPSCAAEFGVISQYLTLRDQMDLNGDPQSFLIDGLDQKVPHYDMLDSTLPPLTSESRDPAPLVQIKTENPLNFLDDCSFNTIPFVSSQSLATRTTTTTTKPSPTAYPGSDYTSYNKVGQRDYVAAPVYSGCTVIERGYSDQQLPARGSESPDLLDLDMVPSLYEDAVLGRAHGCLKTELVMSHYNCDTCSNSTSCSSSEGADYTDGGLKPELFRHCDNSSNNNVHSGIAADLSDESYLIEQIRSEIEYDCQSLGVSTDPTQWSADDMQNWVELTCRKNKFPVDGKELFNLPGAFFCKMDVADFKWRSPEAGYFLYHQLDMVKMTCNMASNQRHAAYQPFPYNPPGPPAPSISPAPSTGSTCSTLSSSSGGAYPSDSMDEDIFSVPRINHNISLPASTAHPHRPAPTTPHTGPRQPKQTIHLWQFLRELLDDAESNHCCIKWTDRSRGVFKIEDSSKVAKLWGRRKNRPAMNYDKLSRSIRQYYKKGIIKKTEQSKRLVYQFCQPYL